MCYNTTMNTGELIKKLRREQKISQAELAKLCNISQQHVSKIENNKIEPRLDTFILILRKLNYDIKIETVKL